MMERIPLVMEQLSGLKAGQERLERLLRDEISDLKQEQIAELRKLLEKYDSSNHELWQRQWAENDNLWRDLDLVKADINRAKGGVSVGHMALSAGISLVTGALGFVAALLAHGWKG